ncbi:MAG: SDR family oxidoreductase [Pontibacterium sp.]
MPSVLIVGCGDTGTALGQTLLQQGYNVYGLRRNINQLPQGFHRIKADLSDPAQLQDLPTVDYVVYIVAASQHDEAGYQSAYVDGLHNIISELPSPPKHLFFTSSSSVYAQNDKSWVDETSPTEPKSFSGRIMLQAEKTALSTNYPSTVVRFTGIYGPGRNHLINQVKKGIAAAPKPELYSNRIHRDDCVGVLAYLINQAEHGTKLEPLYLATDDTPSPMHEVSMWLAQQMGVDITEFSLSRRAGSKLCSNQRLRDLGYRFQYPSYKEGYEALLQ